MCQHAFLVCCQKTTDLKGYRKQVAARKYMHLGAFRSPLLTIWDKSCLWTVSWKGLRGEHLFRWATAAVLAFVDSYHTANGVSPNCKTSLRTLWEGENRAWRGMWRTESLLQNMCWSGWPTVHIRVCLTSARPLLPFLSFCFALSFRKETFLCLCNSDQVIHSY